MFALNLHSTDYGHKFTIYHMFQFLLNLHSTEDPYINYTKYSHRLLCMSYIPKIPYLGVYLH